MSAVVQIGPGVDAARGSYPKVLLAVGLLFLVCLGISLAVLSGDPGKGAWAVFTATFIYVLGVTQLGIVWAAIMRICNTQWGKSFYRLAEVMTIAFMPLGLLGMLFILLSGRDELIYWLGAPPEAHLSPWLNENFLIWRNLLAQMFFYAVALWYFRMSLLPDIDERDAGTGPGWRQALYRRLLAMKAGRDMDDLKRKVYRYSPWMILAYVVPNTLVSWDFVMMLWPHYHSTVFPMYFMQGSLFAGTAAILISYIILSFFVPMNPYVQVDRHVRNIGIMLTGFALLWLYMFWAQFFVTWFGNLQRETGPVFAQMYGHYAPFFWMQMICLLGIPIATLIFAWVKRTMWSMITIGLVMQLGVWINRYLHLITPLENDHVLFASLIDFPLVLVSVSGFIFLMLALFNAFPMVSMWEMRSIPEDRHAH